MCLIVQHLRPRRREAIIGAKPVQAGVLGEALRVICQAGEVIREVEVSVDQAHLAFPIATESSARNDAEEAISPVAILYGVTPTLCFKIVNVVYVERRADVNSSVGIGNRHTI